MCKVPAVEAEMIRRSTWARLAGDPDAVPVDSVGICGALGIAVVVDPMSPDVSSVLHQLPGANPVICLNGNDDDATQRLGCARALGRYLYGVDPEADVHVIDSRLPGATSDDLHAIHFACQFAAHLLIPADVVARLGPGRQAREVAEMFGVTVADIERRFEDLDLP